MKASEIRARKNTNLENSALSQGDDPLTNLLKRLGITEGTYQPGTNVFLIDPHRRNLLCFHSAVAS